MKTTKTDMTVRGWWIAKAAGSYMHCVSWSSCLHVDGRDLLYWHVLAHDVSLQSSESLVCVSSSRRVSRASSPKTKKLLDRTWRFAATLIHHISSTHLTSLLSLSLTSYNPTQSTSSNMTGRAAGKYNRIDSQHMICSRRQLSSSSMAMWWLL